MFQFSLIQVCLFEIVSCLPQFLYRKCCSYVRKKLLSFYLVLIYTACFHITILLKSQTEHTGRKTSGSTSLEHKQIQFENKRSTLIA